MRDDPDLIRSPLAPVLKSILRRSAGRRGVWNLLRRLERSDFQSASLRELLLEIWGVEVGTFSYGACMIPANFLPGLKVGRFVSMARYVRWGLNHPLQEPFLHPVFYRPGFGVVDEAREPHGTLEVCADAWIGDFVVITQGCRRIGVGAVVGAGSVVTHDVPDFMIVAGAPARPIRPRFPEPVCEALLASRWWEKSLADLRPVGAIARADLRDCAVHARVRDVLLGLG